MSACDMDTIHSNALKKIETISNNFNACFTANKSSILKKFLKRDMDISKVVYPPNPSSLLRNRFLSNKVKYFSDHLPIFEESDNMIIISWNIGIGENNTPWPYKLIEEYIQNEILSQRKNIKDYFQHDKLFKILIVEHVVKIIYTYVEEMKRCRKPIVIHLQECSYDVYSKLKMKLEGQNFSSDFMPQEIAKIKEKDGVMDIAKLFYIEERLVKYNDHTHKLGLSSFIFCPLGNTTNIKIYPTSADLCEKENKNGIYEIILESRINLVLIELNGQKYIHYNLHLKKGKLALTNSKYILNIYSRNKFINIKDDTIGRNEPYKKALLGAMSTDSSPNNIIEIRDGILRFRDEEEFNIEGSRYMCGDFNAELTQLIRSRDLAPNVRINPTADRVDYIVEITTPAVASVASVASVGSVGSVGSVASVISIPSLTSAQVVPSVPKLSVDDEDEAMGGGWEQKYFKYKSKYLKLKKELGL
jgi:hypothetical protein